MPGGPPPQSGYAPILRLAPACQPCQTVAMPRPSRLLASLALICVLPASLTAKAPAPARLPITTCMNLGNHLEEPSENAWGGKRLEVQDLRDLKAVGFDTVRLPVRWDVHSAPGGDHAIDPVWMARVTGLVDAALAAHLNVILNSHNFEPINATPEAAAPWLADVWRQIARNFATRPKAHLWFEIENEPNGKLTNANLMAVLGPSLAAIRASNPDRPVIIGGGEYSSLTALTTLDLPKDRNVYPTFHYYDPFDFTHQGATWVHPSPPLGRRYGTPADAQLLDRDVARVKAYIARTGRVPFLGENGANDLIPLDQRVAYTRAMTQGFGPLHIGICEWGYTNTFPFRDNKTGQWLPGMLEAIGLKTP
jgi:endoglucanase